MAVNRDEFDKLVARVDRIEQTLGATVKIISAEVVGLRTYLDGQFARIDGRMDGLDGRMGTLERKFDTYTEQVQVATRQGSEAAERNERFARAIAEHFGIELGDS